ncbi:MAG: hypothetical protein HY324_00385 [Chlamydiia bacterium]|nr:hypothetical protein [Chlamydiia bacterium]
MLFVEDFSSALNLINDLALIFNANSYRNLHNDFVIECISRINSPVMTDIGIKNLQLTVEERVQIIQNSSLDCSFALLSDSLMRNQPQRSEVCLAILEKAIQQANWQAAEEAIEKGIEFSPSEDIETEAIQILKRAFSQLNQEDVEQLQELFDQYA